LGSIEALRWALDEGVLYALAARFRDAGCDGLYLFNFFKLSRDWKARVLGTMVDPWRLARADKRVELDHWDRASDRDGHSGAFKQASGAVSLPVLLEETLPHGGAVLIVHLADNIEAHGGACLTLELGLLDLAPTDALEVEVNGSGGGGCILDWKDEFEHAQRTSWTSMVFSEAIARDGAGTDGGADPEYHCDTEQTEEPPYGPSAKTEVRSVHSCQLPPAAAVSYGPNTVRVRLLRDHGVARLRQVILSELRLHIVYPHCRE
jgi:hypothetical protein